MNGLKEIQETIKNINCQTLQVNYAIDNLVVENLRKIRIMNDTIQNLQESSAEKYKTEIAGIKQDIAQVQNSISALSVAKDEIEKGNWNYILNIKDIETVNFEEKLPIEEINIEELNIEDLNIEIEDFSNEDVELIKKINEGKVQEIEEIYNEDFKSLQEISTADPVIIPLFGQIAKIIGITVNFEDGELVYSAKMSDNKEIKIHTSQIGTGSVLLRDKQNREDCKNILVDYARSEYKFLNKNLIKQIDPLICELLVECSQKYGYNAKELIYNYVKSFDDNEEYIPPITYNLLLLEQSKLSRKERNIIKQICYNAKSNSQIEVIGLTSWISKLKYVVKRLLAINNANVLPEGNINK